VISVRGPLTLVPTEAFAASKKRALKKFPDCNGDVDAFVDGLCQNPDQGDVFPSFQRITIRKVRLPLKAYGIGKSGGLRLLFFVYPDKMKLVPLFLYVKGQFADEKKVRQAANKTIQNVVKELNS